MPKLWEDTIETHRRAVHGAALDAVGALVAERGLRGVTMAAIAERTGIGRATLYRYFSDVNAILGAWHERHVSTHVDHLVRLKDGEGTALERLEAVLGAYATIRYERPADEVAASLHSGPRVDEAQHRLVRVLSELISHAADDGEVRGDVDAGELAQYCLHALTASSGMHSRAAVRRLVAVTMTALRRET